MNEQIGILLVEDDPVWRTMLTKFLNCEPDLKVLHAVATKEETLAYCSRHNVDIVLMDLNLTEKNLDGIEATLELSLMAHPPKVIALTSLDQENVILDAFTAGAIQYITKTEYRKIPELIRIIHRFTTPQEILVKELRRLKEEEQFNKLTAAEKEIVALYEKGYRRSDILRALGKSESTLRNQISGILRKFKANSMRDVVRAIKTRGLSGRESGQ